MSKAKNISRLRNLGLQGAFGRTDYASNSTNTADTWIQTFEIPLTVVASTATQATTVTAGDKWIQILSAVIVIDAAEVTGTTKTISVGIGGSATNVLAATSVAAIGAAGTPVTAAIAVTSGTNKFSYALGSANFVEFRGRAIVTAICANVL
jgi:CRISPR/Cas system type I-B associated protein Csh2 (Cas7 group RAMP superfamily)